MNAKNLVTVESSSAWFLASLNCWLGDNNSGPFKAKAFERPAVIHREKPQAKLVEEQSRSVETVEKEPPFAIIRSG